MTYEPKKGDVVVIRDQNTVYMESPLYIVTGKTQVRYECVSPYGATVYKLAEDMQAAKQQKDLFLARLEKDVTSKRRELEQAETTLQIAYHDRNTSTTSVGASSTTAGSTN
jgi:hypothetical protein